MIETRFAKELYSGRAVDSAVKVFAAHAKFDLEEVADAWIVRTTATGGADEASICDELGNYALGATIEERG